MPMEGVGLLSDFVESTQRYIEEYKLLKLAFCAISEALCSYSSSRALSTHTSENKETQQKSFTVIVSNTFSYFMKIYRRKCW